MEHTDPFAQFMDFWAGSLGTEEAFAAWLEKDRQHHTAYIAPDIEPFVSNSGKHISGRSAWREHLKATGAIELGASDVRAQTERHLKAKAEYQARMTRATAAAPPVSMPERAQPLPPSRTAARVMERLHGRPAPDRPTLIRMAIEERTRK